VGRTIRHSSDHGVGMLVGSIVSLVQQIVWQMPESPDSVAPQQARSSLQIQAVPGMHSHPSAPGQGLVLVEQLLRQAPMLPGSEEKIPQQDSSASQAPSTPVVQEQPS
jgi:hypothetical protein